MLLIAISLDDGALYEFSMFAESDKMHVRHWKNIDRAVIERVERIRDTISK